MPTLAEHIKSGKLRALAVTPRQRVAQLAEVPTLTEAGLPGVDTMPLFGLIAPAGVPAAIVQQLSAPLRASVREGEIRTRLQAMGFLPEGSTPAEFAKHIREESAQ
nr:tripartite tricarboxylate transporter substrate-binding protein [Variovorax boronicumulans]